MRKLGRRTDQRLAMLRNLTTDLILNGKIVTTEAKAKEVKSIADKLIALAVKEKDNFDMVEVKVVKAKLDKDGRKVTEKAKSKNDKDFEKVVKEEKKEKRQKDHPSRLHARRQIMKKLNKVPNVDLIDKLFNEIAPKQDKRVGGYTRIIKMEPRRGDAAEMAVLEILM